MEKKGNPLSAVVFLTPVRSQYNAIRVAGRRLACGGSRERCVWQKILVREGTRPHLPHIHVMQSNSMYKAKLTFFFILCTSQL